jgi:hypothetical protein
MVNTKTERVQNTEGGTFNPFYQALGVPLAKSTSNKQEITDYDHTNNVNPQ